VIERAGDDGGRDDSSSVTSVIIKDVAVAGMVFPHEVGATE
jgi:hypothetical protein